MTVQVANAGGWSEWAACRGSVDTMTMPDLHRPSGRSGGQSYNTRQRARIVLARATCAGCPVLEDCREWALTSPDPAVGMVAGGMTPHQRREAREARHINRAAPFFPLVEMVDDVSHNVHSPSTTPPDGMERYPRSSPATSRPLARDD